MSHTNSWDSSAPADGTAIGLGAKGIRDTKMDIEERISVDHYMDGDLDSAVAGCDGHHRKVTLPEQSSAPDAITDAIILYTKEVGGSTCLYAKDSDGEVRIL